MLFLVFHVDKAVGHKLHCVTEIGITNLIFSLISSTGEKSKIICNHRSAMNHSIPQTYNQS